MMRIKFFIALLFISASFMSCKNDDDKQGTDDMMTDDDMNGQDDGVPEAELLFEVQGPQDTPDRTTFYFITTLSNQIVGDYVTFDGTNSGSIEKPEGFNQEIFNIHQIIVRDSSETNLPDEGLKYRINSFYNVGKSVRRQASNSVIDCESDQNITYAFGELPEYNYATIYNNCDALSRGEETDNLSNLSFNATIPANQMGYVHLRDGSEQGWFQYQDNVSGGSTYSVSQSTLSNEMVLKSPNYSVIPSLLSIRSVNPSSYGTVIARLYSYGGENDNDPELYDYFLPNNDPEAIYRSSAFYDFDVDDDGVRDGFATSIDYTTANQLPDFEILDASIGFNGATSPEDWTIDGTGIPDVFVVQVTSYDELMDETGAVVPVKNLTHTIRTDQTFLDYTFPTIPQGIIDQFPDLAGEVINQNPYLQLAGKVEDYKNTANYEEFIEKFFQVDGISRNESLFFTPKKTFGRFFLGNNN